MIICKRNCIKNKCLKTMKILSWFRVCSYFLRLIIIDHRLYITANMFMYVFLTKVGMNFQNPASTVGGDFPRIIAIALFNILIVVSLDELTS